MSLREVISEIADEMEAHGRHVGADTEGRMFISFAKQLRIALKASEEPPRDATVMTELGPLPASRAGAVSAAQAEAYQRSLETQAKARTAEDATLAERMTLLIGGPEAGVMVPAPRPEVRVGAKTTINGAVYRVTEARELVWDGEK